MQLKQQLLNKDITSKFCLGSIFTLIFPERLKTNGRPSLREAGGVVNIGERWQE